MGGLNDARNRLPFEGGRPIKNRIRAALLAIPGFEPLCRLLTRRHVRVLMYHRFSAEGEEDGRRVPARAFRQQLDFIASHHPVWDPDRQLRHLAEGSPATAGAPVIITADDGYLDFYEVAFPLLRERSLPATLFVTTGFVDGTTWFWWDRVSYLLAHCQPGHRRFVIGNREVWGDPADARKRDALWLAWAAPLRFVPDHEKEALLAQATAACGVAIPPAAPAKYKPVTWDQLREMSRSGIHLGAHTRSHPILSRTTPEKAWAEISGSLADLAEQGFESIAWFCYPQGGPVDYTPEISELVQRAGCRACYTAYYDARLEGNALALPRYCVSPDFTHFRWVLCGAEYLVHRLKSLLRLKTGVGKYYWYGYEDP